MQPRSRVRPGPALSHLHLLGLGWVFYLALPLAAEFIGVLDDMPGAEPFTDYFSIQSPWWPAFVGYVIALPLAYMSGAALAGWLVLPKLPRMGSRATGRILLVLYSCLLVIFTVNAREYLFEGYLQGVETAVVGPVSTLEILLLFEWLVCKATDNQYRGPYAFLLTVCSLVLLGMGGRLYVVTVLVAAYFYWWKWSGRSTSARWTSIAVALAVAAGFAVIGMLRLGEGDFSQLGFYFLAEPMYTGISGLSLVLNGTWSVFDAPRDFFSGFINLVPAAFWPGKSEYLVSLVDSNLDLESPFGALSIVASTIGNFGYAGGLIFTAGVGFVLGWAGRQADGPVGRSLYCVLAAMLPFMFYRDPFQVQVKVVLTCFVLVLLHWLAQPSHWWRRTNLST